MGFGMASVYATGILWTESFVQVTNKISAALVISW
jgi:hypothetical protein